MVIDKGKLIALLVDKTGLSRDEVEAQYAGLKKQIAHAATSGRQFHIDGFGTFGKEEGEIYFEPVSRLKTEINQKYAGMKPIELMAAFKESGAGVPVQEASSQPETTETEVQEPLTGPDKAGEEVPPQKEIKKTEKEEPVAAPVPALPKKKKKPKKKVSAKKTQKKKERRASAGKKSDPIGTVLVAAVIIIAVLVGGWFLYSSGVLNSSNNGSKTAGIPADTTAQPEVEDSTAMAAAGRDSTEQNSGNGVSKVQAAEQEPGTTYGLRGTVNKQVTDGYTIVIHSFRLKSTVQEIADSLSGKGYRTLLLDGSANGESRWRLGLGQFQTVDRAQEAVQELPEPYKENHFIKRIQ